MCMMPDDCFMGEERSVHERNKKNENSYFTVLREKNEVISLDLDDLCIE